MPRAAFLLCIASLAIAASDAAPVSFRSQIAPLLQRRCAVCHDAEQAKGRYRLDSYERLMKPGDSDLASVVRGQPAESELYRLLLEHSPEDRMPQKADPLPENEIALIEQWIKEGAECDGTSPKQPLVEMVREMMLRDAPEKYGRPLPASAIAISPDGARIAVSGYYEVTIWNSADGTLAARIGGAPERTNSLAWHPELSVLAVAGGSPTQWGTVALLDPSNLAPPVYLCDLPEVALSVAFSRDGHRLAAGCGDRSVRIFDSSTDRARRVLKLHADWVQFVTFSPDGLQLLTTSRDRTARVVAPGKREVISSYTSHEAPVIAGAFSLADSRVWTIARGGVLHRWDAQSGEKKGESKGAEFVAIFPFEKKMITVGSDRKIRVWKGDKEVEAWSGPECYPSSAALSPDGDVLAIGGSDGTVTLISTEDGTVIRRFLAIPMDHPVT